MPVNKRYFSSFLVILFLCLLLFFPKEALAGGKSGLLLWFQTILPTLLPFLIVSNLMIQLNVTDLLCRFLYPFLRHLLPISQNGCYPILIGLLSGYPVGAKACADLVKSKKIPKSEGQFLLSLCNNASPMFLISYVALQNLNVPDFTPVILIIILLGSLLSSLTYFGIQLYLRKKQALSAQALEEDFITDSNTISITFSELVDCSILKSFEVVTKIGGYIILFSILAQMISTLTFLPETLRYCTIGFLEITTGIYAISQSTFPFTKKIVLTLMIVSFGGFSSLAQTKSVISGSGLSITTYLLTKLWNAFLVILLTILVIHTF